MRPDFPAIYSITNDKIDLNSLLDQITLPSTGAAAIFTGMVRATTTRDNPHETTYLEYEAYKLMAEAKMKQVADEIRVRGVRNGWKAITFQNQVNKKDILTLDKTTLILYSESKRMEIKC